MDNTVIFEALDTFSVPTKVVDEHLHAPATALKLILFLLRNKNASYTKEDLLSAVAATEQELDDAFAYWCKAGILFKTANRYMFERPKLAASEIMKYTPSQIADRVKKDGGLRFLYGMAEKLFARTVSDTDASLILSLVDWNGIDTEAVALLLQYAADMGMSLSKVQKLGIEWMENGITTPEKAENYIRAQKEKKELLNRIARMLGISHRALTQGEKNAFTTWTEEYGFGLDMINLAYDRTVASTGNYSYAYMNKILKSWHENGFKTVFDAEEGDKKPEKRQQKQSGGQKPRYPKKEKSEENKQSMKDSWEIILSDIEEEKE